MQFYIETNLSMIIILTLINGLKKVKHEEN
ncbi:MAG: hypothetical protein ACJAV5_002078 [Vicingaceae bacterium]|jgi:hypothetical protein